MTTEFDFDLFVIGAGSGGIAAARRAAEYGAKVGIAESDRLGGTCVNRGCVPKKLLVYASRFPAQFKAAQGYGWSPVQSSLDWPSLITAVNAEVDRLNGVYQRMLDTSKVQVFGEWARFVDAHTIAMGDQTITADKVLIAVGGKPVIPDIPGREHVLLSDHMFALPTQPKRIVIIGGGYIGCEFACILNGLGTEVTQVIRNERVLRGFDDDMRTEIHEAMQAHGIRILNNAELTAIAKTETGLQVTVRRGTEETILADAVSLAAVGRKPNIQHLGLEHTRIEVKWGAIAVDAYSQTSEPNVFAVGDCTDRVNLTPVAINEGRAFADTHFGNKPRQMSYEAIPTAIFTTPEAATVGLTEAEAVEQYGAEAIQVYRSRFRPMYYTLAGRDEKTLMKLVVHRESQKVLGAHMVGDSAAEIMQGVAIAVKMGATKAQFDQTVGIHPTAAEEFVTLR